MIELRIDVDAMKRIQHSVTHSIQMIAAMKAAGIPIDGVLITHGITHGTMQWSVEDDIDGKVWVIRWYDKGEESRNFKKVASGKGEAYSWARYTDPSKQESEEL